MINLKIQFCYEPWIIYLLFADDFLPCCVIEWMARAYNMVCSTAAVRKRWPNLCPRRRRVGSTSTVTAKAWFNLLYKHWRFPFPLHYPPLLWARFHRGTSKLVLLYCAIEHDDDGVVTGKLHQGALVGWLQNLRDAIFSQPSFIKRYNVCFILCQWGREVVFSRLKPFCLHWLTSCRVVAVAVFRPAASSRQTRRLILSTYCNCQPLVWTLLWSPCRCMLWLLVIVTDTSKDVLS